jgi:hypothetical protein
MAENKDRTTPEVGREVVSGLENTLAWIKSQFDAFRTEVETEKTATTVSAASNWVN